MIQPDAPCLGCKFPQVSVGRCAILCSTLLSNATTETWSQALSIPPESSSLARAPYSNHAGHNMCLYVLGLATNQVIAALCAHLRQATHLSVVGGKFAPSPPRARDCLRRRVIGHNHPPRIERPPAMMADLISILWRILYLFGPCTSSPTASAHPAELLCESKLVVDPGCYT